MNWITLTIQDLYNSKVAALIDAANSVALGAGQTDRITGTIADVTLSIRRQCARVNLLDADTTKIPGGLKTVAIDVIYCRLKRALEMELSEDERNELKRGEDTFLRIGEGKEFIDPPDTPIAVNFEQAQPAPAFRTRHRQFTPRNQDG